jgi:hypothetical protein
VSEHEKRLREIADAFEYSARAMGNATDLRDVAALRTDLDALLAEHRAEVASARDAALEDLALAADALGEKRMARFIRGRRAEVARVAALKSAPASALPTAKVREVLLSVWADAASDPDEVHGTTVEPEWFAGEVARLLGLSLDAEGACTVRRESTVPPEYEATGELTLASQMDRDEEG